MTSGNTDDVSLRSRVERLERQNRLMLACLICALLAAVGVLVLRAKPGNDGKTLEATQIIIRDADGNKRIVLGPANHSDTSLPPGLFVYDREGNSCVFLSASEGKAGVHFEQNAKGRMFIGIGQQKFAGLMLFAEAGKTTSNDGQIILAYGDDGETMFGLNDSNGNTRAMMMLDKENGESPVFLLQDEKKKAFFSQTQQ
ncbi:hypothetical protein [Stieleria varia]|uniref:Uncharacterized protein n=1 Tax=Stieleria varia TaxID=2528005 RepID=A0A5C6A554_9BACT|nr:hypothetical protein [Stieleria varia]TWT94428.1 hypothetical protein Pla52n_52490 [Stieleria varia]